MKSTRANKLIHPRARTRKDKANNLPSGIRPCIRCGEVDLMPAGTKLCGECQRWVASKRLKQGEQK